MIGGLSKHGRGGGRGGSGGGPRSRNSFPPPNRNPTAVGRLPVGGGSSSLRQRTPTDVKASSSTTGGVEETYSLVPGKSHPAFGMIIRLAPNMVEKIRSLEAQGGTSRIKFDGHSNSTGGNIINIGGKEFEFTWSREIADFCDIYEERESCEDGNGLLVERGCSWRKLSVRRTLDESTTKHVKIRSAEAERKTNSRKAIVLEPGNPTLTKQLALADANPRKIFNKQPKGPPPKKQRVDAPLVGVGGPKPANKLGLAPAAAAKSRLSASPASSTPDPFISSFSPSKTENLVKSHTSSEDGLSTLTKCNESTVKVASGQANNKIEGIPGPQPNFGGNPKDLQCVLINLLKEAPMSLKALEKAIVSMIPDAGKIEPVLKKIATYQAPGKYVLKPEAELEPSREPSSKTGSSPENNEQLLPGGDLNHIQPPISGKIIVENITEPAGEAQQDCIPGEPGELREQPSAPENVDIKHRFPDIFGDENAMGNRQERAGSSSNTGSDSDSETDSSDSGSQSRSRVGGESGSCSDSEASSNSKEGSDVEVDIMSDNDRELKHDVQHLTDGVMATITGTVRQRDDTGSDGVGIEGNGSDAINIERHDSDAVDIRGNDSDAVDVEGNDSDAVDIEGNDSDAVDIEGHSSDDGPGYDATGKGLFEGACKTKDAAITSSLANKDVGKHGIEHFPSDNEKQQFIGRLFDDTENITKDSFNHEQSDSSEKLSKGKTETRPDMEHFRQNFEQTKRLKPERSNQKTVMGKESQYSESMNDLFPGRYDEESCKDHTGEMRDSVNMNGKADLGPQRRFNQTSIGKSDSDFHPSEPRISQSAKGKLSNGSERSNKSTDTPAHVRKPAKKDFQANEVVPEQTRKYVAGDKKSESSMKEKKQRKSQKDSGSDGKHTFPSARNRNHCEMGGTVEDDGNTSALNPGSSPTHSSKASMDKFSPKIVLQREISDLESGELRELLVDEPPVKQPRKERLSKHSDNSRMSDLENHAVDLDKRKSHRKFNIDTSKSPPDASNGVMPAQNLEDLERSRFVDLQPSGQHYLRVDHAEAGTQSIKVVDLNKKSRQNDGVAKQEGSVEAYGKNVSRAPVNSLQHCSKKRPASRTTEDSKILMSNEITNIIDGQKGGISISNGDDRKKRKISLDVDDSSFLKYEKEKPELKDPIIDLSEYKVYVQEYQDKYDIYCSLDKILQSYRNEFQKLGEKLELAKCRDLGRYDLLLKELKETYRDYGEKHKRLKKIFAVLHEELKHLKQRIKDYAASH